MNNKRLSIIWALPALLLFNYSSAQPTIDTLKVVNWNIEWFGSASNGPADDNLQEGNVKTVIQNLNADVYALVEVVDIGRLQNIVNAMPGYNLIVSDFCSSGSTVSSCASAQKLAFIYRASKINKIRSYGLLRSGGSANAYTNWASGRFPFLMEADVTLNNTANKILFIVVHAKANIGTSAEKINSYNRRRDGIAEVSDSLNVQYPTSNFMILGDYNDDLDQTITTEVAPITTSSYSPILTQPDKYVPVTLPLSLAGQNSTAFFPDVIDHVTLSNELNNYYVANSAKIMKTEVLSWISNYATTTSDHYPVQSKYFFNSAITAVNNLQSQSNGLLVKAFNHSGILDVFINSSFSNTCSIQLIDLNGRVLKQVQTRVMSGSNKIQMNTYNLASGIYLLRVNNTRGSVREKIFIAY